MFAVAACIDAFGGLLTDMVESYAGLRQRTDAEAELFERYSLATVLVGIAGKCYCAGTILLLKLEP